MYVYLLFLSDRMTSIKPRTAATAVPIATVRDGEIATPAAPARTAKPR